MHPRYSAGSPAMVDMVTALGVARDEMRAYSHVLVGYTGPENQAAAQKLGLGGIVEWKQEAASFKLGGNSFTTILAYDLLTRTWHVYNPKELPGWYDGSYDKQPRIRVELLGGGRGTGTRAKYNVYDDAGTLVIYSAGRTAYAIPADDVRAILSYGRYRKPAPECFKFTGPQEEIDAALEDAGVLTWAQVAAKVLEFKQDA